jgi:hypothetical protein
MTRISGWTWFSAGLLGLVAPLAIQSASAQSPPVRELVEKQGDLVLQTVEEVLDDVASPRSIARRVALLTDTALPSEYWLGIALDELPEVTKQQLGIESGLVVADIMDDSPAAKAEIKKHDILIKAGDAELKQPTDLIKAVDASQGKEITLVIVRGGKDRKIAVAPVKRVEATQTRAVKGHIELREAHAEFQEEIKHLEEILAKLKSKAGDGTLGLWFAKPAVVESVGEARKAVDFVKDLKGEFPKDLTVKITKEGDQPTKVYVKRGSQEWEVTEDKLSDLPDDVRPHVQKLLGRMLAPGFAAAATRILKVQPGGKVEGELKIAPLPPLPPKPPTTSPVPPSPPKAPVPRLHAYRVESGTAEAKVEAKLDAIMKKLDQLTKEVDELKGRPTSDKK